MLKTFKLKNGLQVTTYHLPNLRSVHLRIATKGGSLGQDKGKSGVAHLMEHLLVQGIPMLPNAETFASYIEGLAGTYSAYTQQLSVGFDLTLPAIHLEQALKITGEVFFDPLFSEEALVKEKQVVESEIKQLMDSKYHKLSEFFRQQRFKAGHPLTLELGGTVDNIRSFRREDLISYWKKYFLPENTYLAVVGNFSQGNLGNLLEKYFGQYLNNHPFSGFPQMSNEDLTNNPLAIRHDSTLTTDYLELTFPSINLSFPSRIRTEQSLALTTFGKLRNSRLFKLLRYQKGLVYDVGSGASLLPGLGFVYISSEVSQRNLEEVTRLIAGELREFARTGPTEDELQFAKNFLANQWLMVFDHPSSIAGWIEGDLLWEKKVLMPEEVIKMMMQIKVSDIVGMMQKYWDFSKLQMTIQGPVKKTPVNMQKYSQIIKEIKNG